MEQNKAKEGPKTNNKTTPVVNKPNVSTPLPETDNYSSDEDVFRSPKRPKVIKHFFDKFFSTL